MRKLLILLTLSLSFNIFAQEKETHYVSISAAFDIKNSVVGSKPTGDKPELDVLFQITAVGNKGTEAYVGYEMFNKINFSKYTIGIGQGFPLYGWLDYDSQIKTVLFVSLEPTIINRWGTWGGGISSNQPISFLSLGANASVRWFIHDHFGFEILFNALPRTDLRSMYGNSNTGRVSIDGIPIVGNTYFKLIYKIN